MARMHSRKKGKSGSTRPAEKKTPSWANYKEAKEVELLVVKYAKEGLPPSQIGVHLRDQYGVPDIKTVTGKNMAQILKEKDLEKEIPEDLLALVRKKVEILNHLEENKGDMTAKRGLQLTESKIRRLAKYYKRTGRLPQNWKYDAESIKLYLD